MPARVRIHKEIEDLLRRLRTDVIDIYQVHWPDPNVPIEETAAAMAELHRAGKIRVIGVSNFSPAQIEAFRKVAPVQTVQPPYNLFERDIEKDVLPYARDKNIATLAYGSLCRGLLTGRMTAHTQFAGDDLRRDDPKFRRRALRNIFGRSRGSTVRPRQLRKARHPSGGALGSRPAGRDDRALGRAAAGPTRPDHGPFWLAYRRVRHGRDRPDRFRNDRERGRSGIHGPACSAGGLRLPKRASMEATCSTT